MDIRKVKKLIELLEESGIDELEIREGEESVRISRHSKQPAYAQPMYAPAPAPVAAAPVAAAAAAPVTEVASAPKMNGRWRARLWSAPSTVPQAQPRRRLWKSVKA